MAFTNTHNVSLEESIYEQFRREWELLVSHEIRIWARFYTFWFTREIPLLAIRCDPTRGTPPSPCRPLNRLWSAAQI